LEDLGLTPGPWISRFKAALYAQVDPQTEFTIAPGPRGVGGTFAVGDLALKIARITPGQKIAYITDVGDSPAAREAIAALTHDADQLFIEAAFLDRERERAAATHHLTARQAGELAALARARRFTLFHFSPRYEGHAADLLQEAQASYDQTRDRLGDAHRR
jgi:ribonuclease Z